MVGNYQSVNVLNKRSFLEDLNDRDAISEVAAMINVANRSQRRKLEKTLNKVERVQAKCEAVAKKRADKQLAIKSDDNFMYVFACVGLTLNEDYHWKEDPDQDHGQITSFFERLTKKMEKYSDAGMSIEDIIKLLDDRTGVQLISTGGK